MKTLYAILPCYNEQENIGKLIDEWNKQKEKLKTQEIDLKIIAIDDKSTDNTKNKILDKKNEYNNVDIIIHDENKGLRGGINTAIEYFNSNANKEDLLVLMDGDNTHNPKYIHEMIKLIEEGNNCVIASRYREGSSIKGLAKSREKMSDFAKIYYTAVLHIPNVKDYTCGYRVYTYEIIDKLLKKYGENPIKEKSFACMMELLYKVYLVGGKFDEVGFELRYDQKQGASKMKVAKTAMRSIITALKLRLNVKTVLSILFLVIFSIILSLGTNYSPINKAGLNHDCGIFSYVGFAMQEGKALYTEVWENKGPLLYFIYYLGLMINKEFGMYLLELVAIFISVLFSYKSIKVITNSNLYSILGTIYAFSIYSVTFESGTISENFALPLICIGVYLFFQYIKTNEISNIKILIFGILTGLILQIRLNILAIFLAIFIVIALKLLFNKKFIEILKWLSFGLLGVVISIIPSLIYLLKNGVLIDCLNTAYLNILNGFNIGTITDRINSLLSMIKKVNISYVLYVIAEFFTISIILIAFKKINKNNKICFYATALAIIINLYANSVSGAIHMHYFITFIPIIVMMMGTIFGILKEMKLNNKKRMNMIITIIIFILVINSWKYYIKFCNIIMNSENNKFVSEIQEYIVNNSEENDLVQLIGGERESVSANFETERLAASKYSYLPLWNTFTEERKREITEELIRDIKINVPKLILISEYNGDYKEFNNLIEDKEEWNKFLDENYIVDSETIEEYIIYKKK